MLTGWQKINNKWYYLDTTGNGHMLTGWQNINNHWYSIDSTGNGHWIGDTPSDKFVEIKDKISPGWQKINYKYYYFNEDKSIAKGWKKINNKWHYFDPSNGHELTGWQKINNKWYYLDTKGSGHMLTGWLKWNDKWYYLDASNGDMKTGEYFVGSKKHISNEKGEWIREVKENTGNESSNNSTTKKDTNVIKLLVPTKVYTNAFDAKNETNNVGTWSPGEYHIYNKYNNMINITKAKGSPGGWINPKPGVVEYINEVDECLAEASDYKDEFVCEIAKHAVELANSHDLYASVMIAQAAIESGYGKSGLSAAPNYNLFGIKGQYKGQSVEFRTFEYTPNGTRYEIKAHFKKYPSYRESLEDYVELLTGYGVEGSWLYNFYYGARRSQTSSYKDATAHLTGRYATSPYYASSLNEFIEEYNLTRFD